MHCLRECVSAEMASSETRDSDGRASSTAQPQHLWPSSYLIGSRVTTLNWAPRVQLAPRCAWAQTVGRPVMSFKLIREVALFLFVLPLYLYTFRGCHSVSLGPREGDFTSYRIQESAPSTSWKEIKRDNDAHRGNWRLVATTDAHVDKSNRSPPQKVRAEASDFPRNTPSHSNAQEPGGSGSDFAANGLSWAAGNVSLVPRSPASASDGYQADFTGNLTNSLTHREKTSSRRSVTFISASFRVCRSRGEAFGPFCLQSTFVRVAGYEAWAPVWRWCHDLHSLWTRIHTPVGGQK